MILWKGKVEMFEKKHAYYNDDPCSCISNSFFQLISNLTSLIGCYFKQCKHFDDIIDIHLHVEISYIVFGYMTVSNICTQILFSSRIDIWHGLANLISSNNNSTYSMNCADIFLTVRMLTFLHFAFCQSCWLFPFSRKEWNTQDVRWLSIIYANECSREVRQAASNQFSGMATFSSSISNFHLPFFHHPIHSFILHEFCVIRIKAKTTNSERESVGV